MAKVNISQAARMTGKDRKTIQRHMEKGTLTFENDAQGRKLVDVSELVRVYGEIKSPAKPKAGESEESPQSSTPEKVQNLEKRISDLERENEDLRKDKEERKEREKNLQAEKGKLLGIVEKQMLLLSAPEPSKKKQGFFARVFGR